MQVCREIRRLFTATHVPIIMVSAKSSSDDVMEGLQAGANDYVKKPFHRQELLTRVKTQIRSRWVGVRLMGGCGEGGKGMGQGQVGSLHRQEPHRVRQDPDVQQVGGGGGEEGAGGQ